MTVRRCSIELNQWLFSRMLASTASVGIPMLRSSCVFNITTTSMRARIGVALRVKLPVGRRHRRGPLEAQPASRGARAPNAARDGR
jgi:hypothetical protein